MMNYTERNNSMKKRKITKITLAALLAAAVVSGGCSQSSDDSGSKQKNESSSKTKNESSSEDNIENKTSNAADIISNSEKLSDSKLLQPYMAYEKYINDNLEINPNKDINEYVYESIYLDDDEIPEVVVKRKYGGIVAVLGYRNNEVYTILEPLTTIEIKGTNDTYQVEEIYDFSYVPKNGLICFEAGHYHFGDTILCTFSDGKLMCEIVGIRCDDRDADGNYVEPDYKDADNNLITEDEYNALTETALSNQGVSVKDSELYGTMAKSFEGLLDIDTQSNIKDTFAYYIACKNAIAKLFEDTAGYDEESRLSFNNFCYIYLDDDDIPELICYGDAVNTKDSYILSCHDGSFSVNKIDAKGYLADFYYNEKQSTCAFEWTTQDERHGFCTGNYKNNSIEVEDDLEEAYDGVTLNGSTIENDAYDMTKYKLFDIGNSKKVVYSDNMADAYLSCISK